jgi:hypothetical protein
MGFLVAVVAGSGWDWLKAAHEEWADDDPYY